jgi:hypothetical protein
VHKLAVTQRDLHLELGGVRDFFPDLYPGYEHRRTIGFSPEFAALDNAEISEGARTYMFRVAAAQAAQAPKAPKAPKAAK